MSWLSDQWEDAKGIVDDVGDFVTDTAESGAEMVGQAIDAGLDGAARTARNLGADTIADTLTDLGDRVADITGGAVDELELGQTDDPRDLVRGDVAAISEAVTVLNELASSIAGVGDSLATIDAAGWTGSAADAFNEVYDQQPRLWRDASDAMTAAANSLTSWRHVVEAAQRRAADAIALWKEAELAEAAAGDDATDTWSDAKNAATEVLRGARADRDGIAGQIVSQLSAATEAAPTEPPFADRMFANATDLYGTAQMAQNNFASGLVTSFTGIVGFVRQVNPLDSYNLSHPAEYAESMSELTSGLAIAASDPGAVLDAMLTDLRENPFEAMGSLTGDAILTLATGGAGSAGFVARTTEDIVDIADGLGDASRLADHVPDGDRSSAGVAGSNESVDSTSSERVSDDVVDPDHSTSEAQGEGVRHEGATPPGSLEGHSVDPADLVDSVPDQVRFLDESDVKYFDDDGNVLRSRFLEHPGANLVDSTDLDRSLLGPDDTRDGLAADSPEVQSLAAEYLSRGPVDPAELRWPDPAQFPDGFSGPTDRHPAVLERGHVIDRFGDPDGRFVSPEGVPYHERALPPSNLDDGYHRYEVVKEIPVWSGGVAPAQGMPGGGTQYLLLHTVSELISGGYLREVS